MKPVFVVLDNDNLPLMVCEQRSDAAGIVDSLTNNKSFKANSKHVKQVIYVPDTSKLSKQEPSIKETSMDMTRSQAENILNGYIRIFGNPNMDDVAETLRQIILDAMTSYTIRTYPSVISYPSTTSPSVTYTCESSTANKDIHG